MSPSGLRRENARRAERLRGPRFASRTWSPGLFPAAWAPPRLRCCPAQGTQAEAPRPPVSASQPASAGRWDGRQRRGVLRGARGSRCPGTASELPRGRAVLALSGRPRPIRCPGIPGTPPSPSCWSGRLERPFPIHRLQAIKTPGSFSQGLLLQPSFLAIGSGQSSYVVMRRAEALTHGQGASRGPRGCSGAGRIPGHRAGGHEVRRG